MKRKIQPKPEPVVPATLVPAPLVPAPLVAAEMLEQAKQSISPDRLKKVEKCSVCGAETATVAVGETLCWVCRRLKISAWREIEQQMPMQE